MRIDALYLIELYSEYKTVILSKNYVSAYVHRKIKVQVVENIFSQKLEIQNVAVGEKHHFAPKCKFVSEQGQN